jgi:hypothetical protein
MGFQLGQWPTVENHFAIVRRAILISVRLINPMDSMFPTPLSDWFQNGIQTRS